MDKSTAKPGRRDGSTPLVITLAGVIVGLLLFIAFGVETSVYGVTPFVIGGAVVGGIVAALWTRRRIGTGLSEG